MNASPRLRLLILGGSGFLSGTLARAAVSAGHAVWTLTRGLRPPVPGVTALTADRKDAAAFEKAIADAAGPGWDLVVDCIGFDPADARQDVAVFRTRARHLVFISTDFVYAPAQRTFPQQEDNPHYASEGYGGKKRLCELELIGADTGSMRWTVMRPCHIYGPGSLLGCLPMHGRDARLLDRLRAGEALRLAGGGHFLQQPVLAADLAAMALSCAGNERAHRGIFHAAGPDVIESREYYRIVADALGATLAVEELRVADCLAERPDFAPFLCHRINDMSRARAAGLAIPSTPIAEGLRLHVKSLLPAS